jgi:hypothetical protein
MDFAKGACFAIARRRRTWDALEVQKKARQSAAEQDRLNEPTHLDESEQIQIDRCLAATPDERWEMNRNFLRSLGLLRHSERKKFGFKSPE